MRGAQPMAGPSSTTTDVTGEKLEAKVGVEDDMMT
jgi:hypothetical protein